MTPFDRAMASIDAANAADPTRIDVDGRTVPAALIYAERMSATLATFAPGASAALRLATRAQHLRRWTVPRDSYPMDRAGYLRWRRDLKALQAGWAREILAREGIDEATQERVAALIAKNNLKSDTEAQILEDVACLVFLQHYAAEFAARQAPDKMTGILRKTWAKMSAPGRVAALAADLDPTVRACVNAALSTAAPEKPEGGSGRAPERSANLRHAAVILAAHGDRGGSAPNATLQDHARALGDVLNCRLVTAGVLKGEPSLETAVARALESGAEIIAVYPMFMADGYFTRTVLPERLQTLAIPCAVRVLDPLGLDPRMPLVLRDEALRAAARQGWEPAQCRLLVVGHGSKIGPASADSTRAVASAIAQTSPFASIATAFLEEPEFLDDALAGEHPPTVVIGFFSGDGLHAAEDVPEALEGATSPAIYAGSIGNAPALVQLIAQSVREALAAPVAPEADLPGTE